MRRIFAVLFGILLGGGLVYTAFEYHVVRTEQTFVLVPKRQAGLVDPYVDIREWPASRWQEHSVLAQNLIADGHGDLVGGSITGGLFNEFIAPFQKSASESAQSWWNSGKD